MSRDNSSKLQRLLDYYDRVEVDYLRSRVQELSIEKRDLEVRVAALQARLNGVSA